MELRKKQNKRNWLEFISDHPNINLRLRKEDYSKIWRASKIQGMQINRYILAIILPASEVIIERSKNGK